MTIVNFWYEKTQGPINPYTNITDIRQFLEYFTVYPQNSCHFGIFYHVLVEGGSFHPVVLGHSFYDYPEKKSWQC